MAFSVIQGQVQLIDTNTGLGLDVDVGSAIPAGTRSFIMAGSDGTNARYVTTDASGNLTVAQSGTWNITNVSGTISLPTGASTSALQTTGNSSLSSIDTKTPSLGQAVMASSVPVAIASNQSAIPINDNSGSLTVDNNGTFAVQAAQSGSWTVAVSGSVAVTGPLTDTQLRASAVPVSGTFFQATQPVSIAATVAVSGPLTDTQLR